MSSQRRSINENIIKHHRHRINFISCAFLVSRRKAIIQMKIFNCQKKCSINRTQRGKRSTRSIFLFLRVVFIMRVVLIQLNRWIIHNKSSLWNETFLGFWCHCWCHKDWKSLFGRFVFVVCIHDHIFSVSFTMRRTTAIKTHSGLRGEVHKSSRPERRRKGRRASSPAATLLQPNFIYFTIFRWFFFLFGFQANDGTAFVVVCFSFLASITFLSGSQ